jgi:hypothetical protein
VTNSRSYIVEPYSYLILQLELVLFTTDIAKEGMYYVLWCIDSILYYI